MPTLIEDLNMPEVTNASDEKSMTFRYTIACEIGESDEDVDALLASSLSATIGEFKLQKYRYAHKENGIYEASAEYSTKEPKEEEKKPGESTFSFETTGGTEKIFYSRSTVLSVGVQGGIAPDFKGGINVTKGNVEGVDILVPKFTFTLQVTMPTGAVTGAYVALLRDLTGTVNDSPFFFTVDGVTLSFEAGELRFDGVRGSKRGTENFDFTFTFAFSKREVLFQVGNGLIGDVPDGIGGDWLVSVKDGWDYLWLAYDNKLDPDTNTIVQLPVSAHIERVYRRTNFNLLGL